MAANPRKMDSQLADKRGNALLGLQQAHIADVATTAATSSTPFGYSEAQANAIVAAINSIIAVLESHGLKKDA